MAVLILLPETIFYLLCLRPVFRPLTAQRRHASTIARVQPKNRKGKRLSGPETEQE